MALPPKFLWAQRVSDEVGIVFMIIIESEAAHDQDMEFKCFGGLIKERMGMEESEGDVLIE